jgi:hypothetical protein
MPRIEREIVIRRPVEKVFDFMADGRNEPHYNPHMRHAEQTSAGPIGRGTRFRTEAMTRGRFMEMAYEITAYERPQRLASRLSKRLPIMDVQSTETFDPVPGGTRMRWLWEVEPRGVFRLMPALLARMLGRRLDTVLANICPGGSLAAGAQQGGAGAPAASTVRLTATRRAPSRSRCTASPPRA